MVKSLTMDDLLNGAEEQILTAGEVVDGKVLSVKKNEILVDLGARGVGMVPRREIGFGKKYEAGDAVSASIVEPELDNGYVLLSLRKAAKERGWKRFRKSLKAVNQSRLYLTMLTVVVY